MVGLTSSKDCSSGCPRVEKYFISVGVVVLDAMDDDLEYLSPCR